MANPYVRQTWNDGPGGGTPVSAARMAVLEQGVFDAHYQAAVRVTHNANQSVTSGTPLALAFNTERFDTESNAASTMHDTATNNSRLTCRTAGTYMIGACIEWASNATGYRVCSIRHQGATTIASSVFTAVATTAATVQEVSTLYQLAVNEYLEVVADQSSGGALNVVLTANRSPEFWMVKVA